MYTGETLILEALDSGFAELRFATPPAGIDRPDASVLSDLTRALETLEHSTSVHGLLVSGARFATAGIAELSANLGAAEQEYADLLQRANALLLRLEALAFPVVAVIEGITVGRGFELGLACDYRLLSTSARVGLPETRLGLIPGWGGGQRLARLIGLERAIDWIAYARVQDAAAALAHGVADRVVEPDELRREALATLRHHIGRDECASRRSRKLAPAAGGSPTATAAALRAALSKKFGDAYPAPIAALDAMVEGAHRCLGDAIAVETAAHVRLSRTSQCRALVRVARNEDCTDTLARARSATVSHKVGSAAVIGAGVMGGGIAYQNAVCGLPVVMKDIRPEAIDLGLREAEKLLARNVERGLISDSGAHAARARIAPVLEYSGLERCDVVIEAVVENPLIKAAVLTEVERQLGATAILASNTSTISITRLAQDLMRPELFAGMHFFNPVHAMALVEVIKGEKTRDDTISTLVGYALALGKKPLVVNDCPGFLVNRVLFPYFGGFDALMRDGADLLQIDAVMERWGWPMGPAYLLDVVGMDIAVHGAAVLAEGFPQRMRPDFASVTQRLFDNQRLGQKSGAGFYTYERDDTGRMAKVFRPETRELWAGQVAAPRHFSEQEIVTRMMTPMCTELARCLEEGVVASPAEADMGLIDGLGFPRFRGGVFHWLDEIGLPRFCEMTAPFAALGELYRPTARMRAMAATGESYYHR